MAETKAGFKVIVKINLPPDKQYQQGHSLILQGDTVAAVEKLLDEAVGSGDQGHGKVILALFTEQALAHGAEAFVKQETKKAKAGPPAAPVDEKPDEAPPAEASNVTPIDAAKPASKLQLAALKKKLGRDLTDEEKSKTKAEVADLLKGE